MATGVGRGELKLADLVNPYDKNLGHISYTGRVIANFVLCYHGNRGPSETSSSLSSYSFIKQNDRTHLQVHVNSVPPKRN